MCLLKKKFPNSVEQNVVRCRNESSFRSCFATVCNYYLSRPIWKRGTFYAIRHILKLQNVLSLQLAYAFAFLSL